MVSDTAEHPARLDADRVYARIAWRLVPFLFACYVCAYLDRVNVGFAKLRMLDALGFSEAVYGLGAGIFFLGYTLFEVPSNLLMLKIGARRTIARIMIAWGLLSAAMMFVESPTGFYVLRFLLGVAEAGFFPGIILYLTFWFPAARRGRVTALFATAVALSTVIGAPLSGVIMQHLDGAHGWAGWQWLFLIEGLPSVAFGLAALAFLDDRVADATWLTADERALVAADIAAEQAAISHHGALDGLRLPGVWLMGLIYFCVVAGLYGLNFWLPSIVRDLGYDDVVTIGLVTALPFAAATVAMVVVGHSADRRNERRWHAAGPILAGAVGLVLSVLLADTPALAVAALTLAACGILGGLPQCWSLATAFLGGSAAAAGIALINSLGNLAGFAAPAAIGWIVETTGSTGGGVYGLAVALVIGAGLILGLRHGRAGQS
ncbi:MAG: MFS transporter [Gammaproteobacteria bacterium]|nr:MFS transporter [Gammaproteobacteria bacterium]MCP5200171.1 MFS transporter [Gammaproteobacteria bacterium]